MEDEQLKRRTSTLKISLNEISEVTKKSMKSRVITAIILALIVVPGVFLGGWYFIAIIFVALVISIFEILRGTHMKAKQWYIYVLGTISTVALTFWIFVKNNMIYNLNNGYKAWDITKWIVQNGFDSIQVSSFLLASILIALFSILVLDKEFKFSVAAYLFLLLLFAGFGFQTFLFLRLYPEYVSGQNYPAYTPTIVTSGFLLIYVILGTISNDIGAYFVGVLFGKNKMIPRISPNKTWEGFVGGIFFSVLFSFLFALIVSWAGHPILPFLSHHEWYYLLMISLVMPFAANVGDLFFSAVKRHLNMKDYGVILVGHGGVLDRVDSLLLVSVVTAMLVILINNGWSFLL